MLPSLARQRNFTWMGIGQRLNSNPDGDLHCNEKVFELSQFKDFGGTIIFPLSRFLQLDTFSEFLRIRFHGPLTI